MRRLQCAAVGGVLLVLGAAGAGLSFGAVDVGAQAPAIRIVQWLRGEPISLADGRGKTIFVVEFWATWCPPCKESIPHLNDLQREFADRGVVVIGITDEAPAVAAPFVAKHERMNYRVACDDGRSTTSAYMRRDMGIPHAFVVDKRGVVVWSGHPMWGLARVLEQVVAGQFDATKAERKQSLFDRTIAALRTNNLEAAIQVMDQIIALDPQDADFYRLKVQVLESSGRLEEAARLREQMATTFVGNARVLNDLAAHYATGEDLRQRDPHRALELASRAVELTKEKDPAFLATLARVYYALCEIDKAIETQRKALAVAAEVEKKPLQAVLDYYLKVKQGVPAKAP